MNKGLNSNKHVIIDPFNKLRKNIVISGSCRFNKQMDKLGKKLMEDGHKVIVPYDVPYPKAETPHENMWNLLFYYKKIDDCNLLLVFDGNGYIGLSTAMEIMYAINKGVEIQFLFEPVDIAFNSIIMMNHISNHKIDCWINQNWLLRGLTFEEIRKLSIPHDELWKRNPYTNE